MFETNYEKQALLCPVCRNPLILSAEQKELVCQAPKAHHFDRAKSGYVNLNLTKAEGDGKEAVRARSAFFALNLYHALKDRLVQCLDDYPIADHLILDAGCGEGYYTNALAKHAMSKQVMGVDLSKYAVDAASKSAKREGIENVSYLVASVSNLPIQDGSVAAVFNIFAPCVEEEYSRILCPGGYLFVAAAGPLHLMGLKEALYDTTYTNRDRSDLPVHMELIQKIHVQDEICVKGESILNLFAMTPYYWRTSPADAEKLARLQTLKTPIDFEILVFRKDDANAKV